MSPFLSFTSEEAWQLIQEKDNSDNRQKVEAERSDESDQEVHNENTQSIFCQTYTPFSAGLHTTTDAQTALEKWARIRQLREAVNKEIEVLRSSGMVGASLQTHIRIQTNVNDYAMLASLGEELKFAFITSSIDLSIAEDGVLCIEAQPTAHAKCERCWHYTPDVGTVEHHPKLCQRCHDNTNDHQKVETRNFV
jgi:isoleucyl-tRNA synthetase